MTHTRRINYRYAFLFVSFLLLLSFLLQPSHAQDETIRSMVYGETVGDFFADISTSQEWQFSGQARDMVQVTVRRIGGRFTPRAELLAPSGDVINPTLNTTDDHEQTLIFRNGLPEDGLYRLQVRGEDVQPLPTFLANDYSLTLEHIGIRLATSDEGVRPLPQQGLTPLPDLFVGQSFLAAPINMNIFGTATLSQPDPRNQRNRYIIESTATVELNNANPLSNGIDAFAFVQGGFAFRLEDSESIFFTDEDVTQLEFVGGTTTIRLANGQLIVTDFYRIAQLQAVDGLVVLRTIDNQRIILEGENFDFRRRGGLSGEGPNAEPINIITVDGTRLDTDLSGWHTFAAIRDGAGRYVRVEYGQGTDFRFIADTMNINLFMRGNSLRPELNPPELDTRLIDITVRHEDNQLPLIIDPLGMGDVVLSGGNLQVKPLDGRIISVASEDVARLNIENQGIRYEQLDGSYSLSLPDGTQIETPSTVADDELALPAQDGYRPRFYNNLGTHIFDYHPDINFTRALMPVNLVNGNFYYAVEDFSVPNHTLELNWTRHYNSLAPQSQTPDYMRESDYLLGSVGHGWRHSYQIDLDIQYAPLGQVRVILADGGTYLFNAIDEAQSRFRSQHLLSWTIERVSGLTGEWRATTTEGLIYDFDRAGRLRRITDADGLSLTFSPMPRQLAATYNLFDGFIVTDTYGRHLELYADSEGLIKVARGVQGAEIHYTYNRQLLTAVEYPGANQTAAYDYRGDLLTLIDDTRSPYHQRMQLTYNEDGQLLQYVFNPDDTESLVTHLNYLTENGHTAIEESRIVEGETLTHRWISDNLFRLIQWQMPKEDWSIRWNYNLETGRLSEYVLPTLAKLRFNFDSLGYLTTYRDPVFTTPYEFTYRATESGLHLLSQIDYPPIGNSLVSDRFVYDENNHLIRVTRPISQRVEQVTQYTYDDIGRLSSMSQVASDEETIETVYTYDEFGYIQSISEGNGSRVSLLRHDVVGRLRAVLDGRGTQYAIGWDDERNLMTGLQVRSDSDSETIDIGYSYDEIGNLRQYRYQDAIDLYAYDGLNYLSTVTDALGRVTIYDYDEVGNLRSITPLSHPEQTVSYTYDEIGMLASSTSASGSVTRYDVSILFDNNRTRHRILYPTGEQYDYTYDAIGHLRIVTGTATQASENREIFDYQLNYDTHGNLTQIVEDMTGGRSLTLAYDLRGNILSSSIGNITTRYSYDRLGRLLDVTNPEGQTVAYNYDALANVIQVVMSDGVQHDYTYDANGNLRTVTNALGYESQFVYDSLNRLTSVRDPEGNITTYAYDTHGNLIGLTDPLQFSQTAEYDAVGRLLWVRDGLGQETQLAYNDLDQLVRITEGGGLLTTDIVYDADGYVSALTRPGNRELLYGRDSFGRLITQTNSLGYSTSYTYNPQGFLESIVNPLGNEQAYSYMSNGRISEFTNIGGEQFAYFSDNDAVGRLTNMNNRVTAVNALIAYTDAGYIRDIRLGSDRTIIHRYTYDAVGRLLTYQAPESDAAWEFVYDAEGQIQTVVDPEGHIARYSYDRAGHITQIVRSTVSTEDAEFRETFDYDAAGQIIRYTAPDGFTSDFVYDENGRLIRQIDGGIRTSHYEYDELGRLRRYEDSIGNVTLYRYDEFGNVIGIERSLIVDDQATPNIYRFEYDSVDNLIGMQLPSEEQINQTYNVLNQRVRFVDALNNGWAYSYDAGGNLIQLSDPLGNSITYEYDLGNRLVEVAYANSDPIELTYDGNGNLSVVRLPENNNGERERIEYVLDGHSNLIQIRHSNLVDYPDRIDNERDNLGRIISMTLSSQDNTNGNNVPIRIRFVYNSQGQIAEIESPDGRISRDYDNAGRLIQITGADGTTIYEYDDNDLGQLVQMRSASLVADYEYDEMGHLTVRDIDGVGRVEYTYDSLYRPIQVTIDDTVLNISYDANGRRTSMVRDNGLETRYAYDANGRIRNVLHVNADGDRLDFFAYEYDVVGNIVRITRGDNTSVLYSYDAHQQLISERWLDADNQSVYAVSYRYDDVGNRVEQVTRYLQGNPQRTTFSYNERNQIETETRAGNVQQLWLPVIVGLAGFVPLVWLLRRRQRYLPVALIVVPMSIPFFQIASTQVEIHYTYDTTGTLLSITDNNNRSLDYDYDAFNRLVAISGVNTEGHPVDLSLTYDSMGRVIGIGTLRETVESSADSPRYERVRYEMISDAFGLVSIQNVTDRTEIYYFSVFPDEVIMMVDEDSTQWPLHDALGTVRRLADDNGILLSNDSDRLLSIDIGAYGELLQPYGRDAAYPITEVTPLWIGQVYEPSSATYTMGVRTYDSRLGRFLQRDPVRHDPRSNLYTYAYNRPTVYSDITGLTPETGLAGTMPDIDDADSLLQVTSPLLPDMPSISTVSMAQAAENHRLLQVAQMAYFDMNITTGLIDPSYCDFYTHEINPVPDSVNQVLRQPSNAVIAQFDAMSGWQQSRPDARMPINSLAPLQGILALTQMIPSYPMQGCNTPLTLPNIPHPQVNLSDTMQRLAFNDILAETPLFPSSAIEVDRLLNIGQFPEVTLPTVAEVEVASRIVPPLVGQVGQLMEDTRAFYADVLLPDSFGLRYEWRRLAQVYDIAAPIVRRVR